MSPANPTPHPLDAAARDELARKGITPRGLDLDSETSEVPRFWRCMCCQFATADERHIHNHLDETGHGFVSDNEYARLLALLAAVERGEAETARLDNALIVASIERRAEEWREHQCAPPLASPDWRLAVEVADYLARSLRDEFGIEEPNEDGEHDAEGNPTVADTSCFDCGAPESVPCEHRAARAHPPIQETDADA